MKPQIKNKKNQVNNIKIPWGKFALGDQVQSLSLISCNDETKEISFKIQWKKREDGIQPDSTVLSNNDIKKHDPLALINFYENNILFSTNLTKKNNNKNEEDDSTK